MHWTSWIAAGLGVVLGAWMMFDGVRAFVTGDYVTPSSGEYAGQLGPWAKVVSAVGLEPRSAAVKSAHVGLGLFWLAAAGCFAARVPGSWGALLACAIGSLWYAPFGTVIGVVEIALLLLPATRGVASG
jgi:putative Mn2+ efflux pump MntP